MHAPAQVTLDWATFGLQDEGEGDPAAPLGPELVHELLAGGGALHPVVLGAGEAGWRADLCVGRSLVVTVLGPELGAAGGRRQARVDQGEVRATLGEEGEGGDEGGCTKILHDQEVSLARVHCSVNLWNLNRDQKINNWCE